MDKLLRDEMARGREEAANNSREAREELAGSLSTFSNDVRSQMSDISSLQKNQLESFAANLNNLTQTVERQLENMRGTVEGKLSSIQEDNANKLEQMRVTVDEKLHATLEQRLGESFSLVSQQLEQVHKGLGEMQTLASGVGDLKKVLTNIRTRGSWGEIQLGNLLEQILTPDQYATNVAPKPDSNERVEYAIKLPGREDSGAPVWLPIDAKFPQEDYQRLLDAQDAGNIQLVDEASKALEVRMKFEAKRIHDKYVSPPDTTDFAIMFLPTEGLFAEVLRRPGLFQSFQLDYHVIIMGPTTLGAILNSLQMGFKTLAIEKRSSEVWAVLGAVKTEFGKFGDVLGRVQKKLHEASKTIDSAAVRTRMMQQKLKLVQEMPTDEATRLLGPVEIYEESEEPEEEGEE